MFTNILFLVLALLLMSTSPSIVTPWIESPSLSFLISILLYISLCGLIYLQHHPLKKIFKLGVIQILINIELLIYLMIYQYVLAAGRLFQKIPGLHEAQTLNTIWELLLYLGGLGVFYCVSISQLQTYHPEKKIHYALRNLRLLIPFSLPFLIMTLALDIVNALPVDQQAHKEIIEWGLIGFSLVLIIIMMIFLPYFIQKIWKCHPLPEGELKKRLLKICQQAHFKHAGMNTWSIMHDQLTAGIIGIVPRFRYVMFTDRLIKELPPESIEAILVHEIGHSAKKHLLMYPFILAGMTLCTGLFFFLFSDKIAHFLELQNTQHPSILWDFFNPFVIFSLYAIIIWAYFRVVFGFFSRLFERQADLHVFEVGLSPENMIHALEAVAYTSGGYDAPNWHHYSIKQRIDFLNDCIVNPQRISSHHLKVKIALIIYFFLFSLTSLFLVYLDWKN